MVYPFLDFFFRSAEALALPLSIDLIGWLTNGDKAEDTLPSLLSLENGFDCVFLGLRLLTPLRPIFCSLMGQSSREDVDLIMLSGRSESGFVTDAAI